MTATSIAQPPAFRKAPPLDDLLIELYCLLHEELPAQRWGRPRETNEAEMVTLAVAQMLLDCPKERVFLRRAPARLGHLFPHLPSRPQYNKRVRAAGPLLVRALTLLAQRHPNTLDDLLLIDSTSVPAGTSRATARRSDLVDTAAYGRQVVQHRFYWGYKLMIAISPDGFPVAFDLVPANTSEQNALRAILPRLPLPGRTVLGDQGFAGRAIRAEVAAAGGTLLLSDGKKPTLPLRRIRQRVETVFVTLKGQLSLERHGGRTIAAVTARILARLLALAAVLWHGGNHGRPGRHVAAYDY